MDYPFDFEFYMGCSAGGMKQEPPLPPIRFLTGGDMDDARRWMEYAAKVAGKSTCTRSKRGAIIVKSGHVVGEGFNAPHATFEYLCQPCIREQLNVPHKTRYELCCGEHAERAALDDSVMRILKGGEGLECGGPYEGTMYHIALNESGEPVRSGEPSCTLCSGPILKWGIKEVVLWQGGDIYKAYGAREFHELSIENMIKHSGLDHTEFAEFHD